jgi:hypothetical protein
MLTYAHVCSRMLTYAAREHAVHAAASTQVDEIAEHIDDIADSIVGEKKVRAVVKTLLRLY